MVVSVFDDLMTVVGDVVKLVEIVLFVVDLEVEVALQEVVDFLFEIELAVAVVKVDFGFFDFVVVEPVVGIFAVVQLRFLS